MRHNSKKASLTIINALAWGGMILSSPAYAFDGSFDSSWETFGDVEVTNPSAVRLSTDGLFDDDADLGANNGDFNYSGTPAAPVGFVSPDLSEFLGVPTSALDVGGFAYEGSAIKKTINVKAGDILQFTWDFSTNETLLATDPWRGSFLDYTFLLVNNQIIKLADTNNALVSSTSIFDKETGIQNYEYTFNNAGTQTIAFGLVDIDDFSVTSAVTIKGVSLKATPKSVPEPVSILGTGLAVFFSLLYTKRTTFNKT